MLKKRKGRMGMAENGMAREGTKEIPLPSFRSNTTTGQTFSYIPFCGRRRCTEIRHFLLTVIMGTHPCWLNCPKNAAYLAVACTVVRFHIIRETTQPSADLMYVEPKERTEPRPPGTPQRSSHFLHYVPSSSPRSIPFVSSPFLPRKEKQMDS